MNSDSNGGNGKNGVTKLHYIATIALASVGIISAAGGVYSSLNAAISSNVISIIDVRSDIKELKEYNAELRQRLLSADQETRAAMRVMAEKMMNCKQ